MSSIWEFGLRCAELGWVPDPVLRWGIRRLVRSRAKEAAARDAAAEAAFAAAFVERARQAPLAVHQDRANAQHYEVPSAFFQEVLGPHLKYSSCFFPDGVDDLATAERSALDTTIERAHLSDGEDVLELGCGWGSLTLAMAERFPRSRITAVSNSATQRAFIESRCRERGHTNVTVLTRDIAAFAPERQWDRIVSVEMFEHVRNWPLLFERAASWLRPGGEFFLHVFCHRSMPYEFETDGSRNWMGQNFFTGGIMPSLDLAVLCRGDLALAESWQWDGTHYGRTAEAWLRRIDAARARVITLLDADPRIPARRAYQRWRLFFLACAELFGFDGGREWLVGHYRFRKPPEAP